MAQILVRNIEGRVKARLQRRAKRHGRSMEEEVRDILRDATKQEESSAGGLGTEIANLFAKFNIKSDLPKLRGYKFKPANFRK